MGKYFVIGGAGFIGRLFVDTLAHRRNLAFLYDQNLTNDKTGYYEALKYSL
jgi:nucleoside-diphosphate-sugar epimerase